MNRSRQRITTILFALVVAGVMEGCAQHAAAPPPETAQTEPQTQTQVQAQRPVPQMPAFQQAYMERMKESGGKVMVRAKPAFQLAYEERMKESQGKMPVPHVQ